MYAITAIVGPMCFQLLFRQEEKAREAQTVLAHNPATAIGSTEWIAVVDEFGHEITCERKHLAGYIFEDLEKTKIAHVERALHQQRTQNLAQKTASSDPGLRMNAAINGGSPMLSPFPRSAN